MTLQYEQDLSDSGPQRALQLYDEEKLTQAEIARRMDISQSTVSIWIQKARQANGQVTGKSWDIHYRVILRDLLLILLVLCAVIITIDVTHIAWP